MNNMRKIATVFVVFCFVALFARPLFAIRIYNGNPVAKKFYDYTKNWAKKDANNNSVGNLGEKYCTSEYQYVPPDEGPWNNNFVELEDHESDYFYRHGLIQEWRTAWVTFWDFNTQLVVEF
ncbi:hypothetical protein [Oleiharenicola lentus]|uniref:hypothetical protein n=1 Tax=Oleiharenicola lentus TaxID=2508720 RepID=UPI003F67E4FB